MRVAIRHTTAALLPLWASTGIAAPPPPPPPKIYDPVPGPFIIHLDARGRMLPDQDGIIANAVEQWRGERLQAFRICYRDTRRQRDRIDGHAALEAVAASLKRDGARTVVAPNGLMCETDFKSANGDGPHVEIMGVVAF